MKYDVLIPARNEEENISKVLESLRLQTLLPQQVVVVSDGSSDETVLKIQQFVEDTDPDFKVTIINKPDRGFNAVGTPFITDTYNVGLAILRESSSDYVLILGADTILEPDYIRFLVTQMANNPRLAVVSGICKGEITINLDHVSGSGRVIRTTLLDKMGYKLPFIYGWETSVLYVAKAGGYEVRHFAQATMHRLRPDGTLHRTYTHWGRGMRALGYTFPVMLARALRHGLRRGIRSGIELIAGYSLHTEHYHTTIRNFVKRECRWRIKQIVLTRLP